MPRKYSRSPLILLPACEITQSISVESGFAHQFLAAEFPRKNDQWQGIAFSHSICIRRSHRTNAFLLRKVERPNIKTPERNVHTARVTEDSY